jgi:flavodoxin
MYHCVIIYAPQDQELKETIKRIKNIFTEKIFKLQILSASEANISDIALADLVILGSKKDGASSIHKDFAELLRTFTGINLSGKMVGFITTKGSNTFIDFKNALKDSGITYFEEPLHIEEAKETDNKKIKNWVEKIKNTFKEFTAAHAF